MTDTRSSALFKRAEQLKRWEESDTNKQSTLPKRSSRVQFSPGIVFLAACTAGDKEEVQKLLKMGADINTANVDGLTALHQACIDDNLEMVEYLVANGADVNRGDNEGWTPLHATASCGFLSIARFLIENGANVDVVNHDGELPVDISDSNSMTEMLKKVIEEKGIDCEKSRKAEADSLLNDARNWAQNGYVDVRDPKTGGTPLHVAAAKGYLKVAQTLLEDCHMESDCLDYDGWSPLHAAALWAHKDAISLLLKYGADPFLKNYAGQTCLDLVDPSIAAWLNETLKKNRVNNNDEDERRKPNRPQLPPQPPLPPQLQPQPPQAQPQPPQEHKRVQVHITGQTDEGERDTNARAADGAGDDRDPPSWRRSASFRKQPDAPRDADRSPDNDTILRRAHSFENDKTFYQRYRDVTARIKATSCPSIPPAPVPVKDTNDDVQIRLNPIEKTKKDKEANSKSTPAANQTVRSATEGDQNSNNSTPSATTPTKLSPGNIFKNFFKSFVPPVRDEESETQRKAHAKRVRETRRSTQGVTLDEIKSAEQLVNKKPTDNHSPRPEPEAPASNATVTAPAAVPTAVPTATTETATPPTAAATATIATNSERRPSWRLRLDLANKFELEDAGATTVTLPLRRPPSGAPPPPEEKDSRESSSESKSSGGASPASTQAALNVIQRRRRPKRRSTGFGNVDMDEIVNNVAEADVEIAQSGSERTESEDTENRDYKALYEASMVEVRRLRALLTTSEQQLREARATITRLTQLNQNSLSEIDKREKRALERKLSEMEEELKYQQTLQTENQRLKDENGALIRVISKLSK